MKCLQVLSISSNPSGLFALSSESSSYLAFPTGSLGGVVLYDCLSLRLISQIDAHKNSVVALTFNRFVLLLYLFTLLYLFVNCLIFLIFKCWYNTCNSFSKWYSN